MAASPYEKKCRTQHQQDKPPAYQQPSAGMCEIYNAFYWDYTVTGQFLFLTQRGLDFVGCEILLYYSIASCMTINLLVYVGKRNTIFFRNEIDGIPLAYPPYFYISITPKLYNFSSPEVFGWSI